MCWIISFELGKGDFLSDGDAFGSVTSAIVANWLFIEALLFRALFITCHTAFGLFTVCLIRSEDACCLKAFILWSYVFFK